MFRYFSAVVVLAFAGCGSSDIGYVSGTVTMDDKPLAGAVVEFFPEPTGAPAIGLTDKDGKYELTLGRDTKGVKVGDNKVQISTADGGNGDDDGYGAAGKETVPARYNVNTELKETVKAGNNTIDFKLESGGEIIQTPENY